MNRMVVPTILACFLNNMFNFAYFCFIFWIKHPYSTSKIIQFLFSYRATEWLYLMQSMKKIGV